MKSSTCLDSAVFQLTPTRTRCDLIIRANEKTEKIASGLLNPFLTHLKTAQDQVAKGGYTILLEPGSGTDATWFTKGAVERFVRFVSTPEILERVYTIDSEILQIEEAIIIKSKADIGLNAVRNHQRKPARSSEGNKPMADDIVKAIVRYEHGAHPFEENGFTTQEGNSKVQLLEILKTRKGMLQKEQGMAFARAVAAGFDIDSMAPLVSFSQCFGAERFMDACLRYINIWKAKHESGQWPEIEAAETMSSRSKVSATNASGITFSGAGDKHNQTNNEGASENIVISNIDTNKVGQQENFQGQYPHPMLPSWPLHSPPGTLPMFQAYPVQGVPYYQNHSVNGPFYQPTYPPVEESQSGVSHVIGRKRHSLDSRESNTGSEIWGTDTSKIRSPDDLGSEKEVSLSRERRKKADRSDKKLPGVVVIRNINYISSKRQNSSGCESEPDSGCETDEEAGESHPDAPDTMHKNASTSSKRRVKHNDKKEIINGKETDAGQWQVFQKILLRDTDGDGGNASQISRVSNEGDKQFMEINGGKGAYQRIGKDDFMISGHRKQSDFSTSSDPLAVNGFKRAASKLDRKTPHDVADESFIVPFRRSSLDQVGTADRAAIVMGSELSSIPQKSANFEPDNLSSIDGCKAKKLSAGYDPRLDFKILAPKKNAASGKNIIKQGSKKLDKDQRLKVIPDEKKSVGLIRKGKLPKLSPLDEARARAERLRTFKADLQKIKKEKEVEDLKRLEALKIERQKRIAARGSSSSTRPPLTSLQATKKMPTKLSPSTYKGSKFSDSGPGLSSPLQRSKIRTTSLETQDSPNVSKGREQNNSSHLAGNRLSRSVSSLSESKKERCGVTPDPKASSTRFRRLSEPKIISTRRVASVKVLKAEAVLKPKASDGLQSKKISANTNLDKSKAAALPELNTKISFDASKRKVAAKTMAGKVNGIKSSATALKRNSGKFSLESNVDDKLVIEKTVVMGENKGYHNKFDIQEKMAAASSTNAPKPAPILPVNRVDKKPIHAQLREEEPISVKVKSSNTVDESLKSSRASTSEKPHQARHARISSLVDPCHGISEVCKEASTRLDSGTTGRINPGVSISDCKIPRQEQIPEAIEKPVVKESSKGFRRLLNLGKKKSSPVRGEHYVESDNTNDTKIRASSLRASRHFSLLSPFRSKRNEKK